MQSFLYRAFGLSIASDIELPELPEHRSAGNDQVAADVVVTTGPVAELVAFDNIPSSQDGDTPSYLSVLEEGLHFHWEGYGSFLVRDGRTIVCQPDPSAESSAVRLLLLGVVMALLLLQRGLLVLHGSAVELPEGAVAFIGEKGYGKSTTTATLVSRGARFLTDDVLAVSFDNDGTPWVVPAFPQMKLWPDAAERLGTDPESLPLLLTGATKRAYRFDSDFDHAPAPLQKLYVLDGGPELRKTSLPAKEALWHLMTHSFATRFGKALVNGSLASTHFQQCSALAAKVPAFRLERRRDLAALTDMAELLEQRKLL